MRIDRNYNQAIIHKLAKRSQAKNRARNFFACLAITLSVALIFAFFLYLDGTQTEKLRLQANSTHVTFENITLSQLEQLRQDTRIAWAGGELAVGRQKSGSVRLTVNWMDKQNLEHDRISYTGEFPEGGLDIMVSQEYLGLLEEDAGTENASQIQPGDTLPINLGDGVVRDYRISAIYDKASKSKNSQHVYVSLPCAAMLLGKAYQAGNEQVNAIVSLENAVGMQRKDAAALSVALAAATGISAEQIKLNDAFFTMVSLSRLTKGDYLTFFLVTLLILVASGIVIHTVFYISIAGRVREYGQLRTIGMTKRQVRCLILWEGAALALKGSLAGLFIGGGLGYVLVPGGFDLKRSLCAALLCTLLAVASVLLSLWKPGNIAATTAPIAALGYLGYSQASDSSQPLGQAQRKKSGFKNKRLTPDYLAALNLKRNRKKRMLTLSSLMFSGILLGTIASYVVSYDPIASVKIDFPNGEYKLEASPSSGFGSDHSLEGQMKMQSSLQADGILGEELKAELQQQKGVVNAQPWRLLFGCTTLFQDQEKEKTPLYVNGISKADFDLLRQMAYDGPASYEELLEQPCLIVVNNYLTQLRKHPLSTGDLVPFAFYDGSGNLREEQLPVLAVVDPTGWLQKNRTAYLPLSLTGSSFMMADSTLDRFAGMSTVYGYEIKTEANQTKEAGAALEEMYGQEENLFLSSKLENAAYYQNEYRSTQIILYSLAVFVVIFGVINLANTSFTNLYSRKRELGILQAVGMTQIQLRRMLYRETAHYTGISAFCTVLPGGLLGYALVMAQLLAGMNLSYTYPWVPVLLYILLLFVLQRVIARYGLSLVQKGSLVEQMKM
ncbi:MAG: FtsX-like permease family protein [Eubacterium sp.]|nr:FtsX-like permease family protein [Eubacterium sp.]